MQRRGFAGRRDYKIFRLDRTTAKTGAALVADRKELSAISTVIGCQAVTGALGGLYGRALAILRLEGHMYRRTCVGRVLGARPRLHSPLAAKRNRSQSSGAAHTGLLSPGRFAGSLVLANMQIPPMASAAGHVTRPRLVVHARSAGSFHAIGPIGISPHPHRGVDTGRGSEDSTLQSIACNQWYSADDQLVMRFSAGFFSGRRARVRLAELQAPGYLYLTA